MREKPSGTSCFRVLVVFLLGSLIISPAGFPADAPSGEHPGNDEKIVFLRLVVTADSVHLDHWTTAAGILKKPRSEHRGSGIRYQAVLPSGKTLWHGSLGDPLTRRLEIEDPPGSGRLSTKIVMRDSATVVLRLPAALQADRIEFRKSDPSGTSDGKTVRRRLIGTIPWPLPESR